MEKLKQSLSKPKIIIVIVLLFYTVYLILDSNKLIPEYPERFNFVIALLILFWGIIYFLKKYIIFIKSKKWLSTSAVVEECKTVRTDDSEGTTYTPIVTYKYKVGNEEFVSDRIYPFSLFLASSFESISKKFIDKYSKNQVIKAYYNPANPYESYVERKGATPIIIILSIHFLVFIVIFLFILGVLNP
jgi:hypothetical protein